jgi:hypothetical protein
MYPYANCLYAVCRLVKCHLSYAECRYTECQYAELTVCRWDCVIWGVSLSETSRLPAVIMFEFSHELNEPIKLFSINFPSLFFFLVMQVPGRGPEHRESE